MAALILPSRRVVQPQGAVEIDWGNPLSRKLVVAINPSSGERNLAKNIPPNAGGPIAAGASTTALLHNSGATSYAQSIVNTDGFTLFTVMRSREASQYLFSDSERTILATRTAGNQGWAWGRTAAADIGSPNGNATRQTFTLNGIAAYTEANPTIESFVDTPVALRYARSAGLVSWFSNGRKSSNDTTASTAGTVGGDLVYRRSGPYASNINPYIDRTGVTFVFERQLSDAEIAALSQNPWQLFRPLNRSIYFLPDAGGGGATNYTLSADAGSYSLTGQDAVTSKGSRLSADAGSYSLTGFDASGVTARNVAGEFGAYSLAGQDATLTYAPGAGPINYTLTADVGAYLLTGFVATTSAGKSLSADAGAYTTAGQAAGLAYGRALSADVGLYSLAGQDATLAATVSTAYALAAEAGLYSLDGQSAELAFSGASVDTHDGFFAREYRKMWEYKKPTIAQIVEEIQEDAQEIVEAVPEVKAQIREKYGRIDYEKLSNNLAMQRFVAKQIQVALELRRIELDEEDAEILLML